MAKCPRCGRSHFRYELRSAGTRSKSNYYRTGIKNSWFIPAGQKSRNSQRDQKSIGICPDCGYIEEQKEKGCIYYLLYLLFLPIIATVWFYRTDFFKFDKRWRLLIIFLVWLGILVAIVMKTSPTDTLKTDEPAPIVTSEPAPTTTTDFSISNTPLPDTNS